MSKPRKKYKPKGVRLDTMAWVMSGMKHISQVEHAGLALKIKNHDALTNITQGRGTRGDIDLVIAAMNVAEAMAMLGHGNDWRPEINAAQEAIYQMGKRGLKQGDKFLFTGPEMQAVNLGMDVHDAQLDDCTVKQLEDALKIVDREIRYKRAKMIKAEECLPQL
jgi:hypothetical protein